MEIAWRFGSSQTDDPLMISLLQGILFNRQAGLLDIHLNQNQAVLESEAWGWYYEDYSVFGLFGKPREGQSEEEVVQLLLAMIEKLRKGDFPEWLIKAVIRDMKLHEQKALEQNSSRVSGMTHAFILGVSWERFAQRFAWMEQRTKADIVDFVNMRMNDNYAIIYKRQGTDPNVIKVEKPAITPVELQRGSISEFGSHFLTMASPDLAPEFVDFDRYIKSMELSNGVRLDYVHNEENELFRLDYIFEIAKSADLEFFLALLYLPYLGTDRYTAAELQTEFFKLGLSFDAAGKTRHAYLTLSGLEESLEAGMILMEHILTQVQGDQAVLQKVVADILSQREHAKKDRSTILREAMVNFARYGDHNPFTDRLSTERLNELTADELVHKLKVLPELEHHIYYHGSKNQQEVAALLETHHRVPQIKRQAPPRKIYPQLSTPENQVFFLDFPILQADIMLISQGTPHFNLEEHVLQDWFNDYFGVGLSSLVFQEIRESKALAYSTYSIVTSPKFKEEAHYLQAYVGTQPDKMQDAIPALLELVENMPVIPVQIESSRQSILKRLESTRVPSSKIYWERLQTRNLGLDRDLYEDIYAFLQKATVEDLVAFHQQYIKGSAFRILVLGDKKFVDLEYLKLFGPVRELSMEEVFGY